MGLVSTRPIFILNGLNQLSNKPMFVADIIEFERGEYMESFLNLLEMVAEHIMGKEDLSDIKSGEAFEKYVVEEMKKLAEKNPELPSSDDIYQTGANTFPDIVIEDTFGVEVKFSKSGKWVSLGNSIFESTSVDGLEQIYLFFGRKVDNKIEVKFKPYEESLVDVKVTHSPRFIVDMTTGGASIFNDLHISYNHFKELDKIEKGKQIKAYFRSNLKEGQEVWFLDNEESQTDVIVNSFSGLDDNMKNKLLLESYILFPEVFSNSSSKYARVATYWLTKYQVYNSALRDKFSASGQVKISVSQIEGGILVSKIYGSLYRQSNQIKEMLTNADSEFFQGIKDSWHNDIDPEVVKNENIVELWLGLIDKYGVTPYNGIKPSNIFMEGLLH